MKIGAVQFKGLPGDVRGNLSLIRSFVQRGAKAGCRLLLFPEATDLGYDPSIIAQHAPSAWPLVEKTMSGLAREHKIFLACGVCASSPDGLTLTNTLAVWDAQGELGVRYDKIHLFQSHDSGEQSVFLPGSRMVGFELDGIRFGLSICYDLRFPELFRAQALAGCHVFLVASAWPRSRAEIWTTLCQARAMENQCFLLGANRVGEHGIFPFCGQSLFCEPTGQMELADARESTLLAARLDLAELDAARRNIPALTHRRTKLYDTAVMIRTLTED